MQVHVSSPANERGAVLVHVAIAILGLTAFLALTVDYGILWMSRRQAQNAADAAAHAGAVSLAFDAPNDFDRARLSAKTIGEAHTVFGQQLSITLGSGSSGDPVQDISFPDPCPPGAPGLPDTCVRVNVYRNSVRDPLPTFFARLIGRSEQGVQATATAQVLTGNASDCLKPWAVADKWDENVECVDYQQNGTCRNNVWQASDTWTTDSTFDKYTRAGNQAVPDLTITGAGFQYDEYRAPGTLGPNDPGTGFAPFLADGVTPGPDYGLVLALKLGSGNDGRISSGWFKALDMPCVGTGCPQDSGANKYGYNITNCSGVVLGIGDTIPVETGNMAGATEHGAYKSVGQGPLALVERDPNAYWDGENIVNSCIDAGSCPQYRFSPRIVPVPLFNVDSYLAANPSGSGGSVTITNIFGFFVITPENAEQLGFDTGTGNTNDTVYGVMLTIPGLTRGTSNVPLPSAFLRQIVLVR